MKPILATLIFSLISSVAWSQAKEFSWLIGTWKSKGKNSFERWFVAPDGKTLKGIAFRINGNDTTTTEQLTLTFDGTSYHYIPDIAGSQGEVDFKITRFNETAFVAENPAHDFPKLIRYSFRRDNDKDILEAAIEGDGRVIPFPFERVR